MVLSGWFYLRWFYFPGSPVHVLSTDGFQQGVDELLQFFYSCQFPRHAVEILWSLQDEATEYCTLASQVWLLSLCLC